MISIALTTHNGSKFIFQQLTSILNQTYKDFELIIVDDCSTDNTFDILQDFQTRDSRIKLCKNEQNLGFLKNFEKAMSLCTGDFIALSDQDDIWTEDHLEVLYNNLGNHYLISANAELIDENDNSLHTFTKALDYTVPEETKNQLIIQFIRNTVQGCTCLFRRELLDFYSPTPKYLIAHDYWLGNLACMLPQKNNIEGLTFVNKSVLKYRQHSSNEIGAEKKSLKRYLNHFFRTSTSYYKSFYLFLSNLDYTKLEEDKKIILDEIKNYLKNMSKLSTRFKAIPYFVKNCNIIYGTPKKNSYTFMWFIKLFILLR